jgi:hypothetical protein
MKKYLMMAGVTVGTMFVFDQLGKRFPMFEDYLGPTTVADNAKALGSSIIDALAFWR